MKCCWSGRRSKLRHRRPNLLRLPNLPYSLPPLRRPSLPCSLVPLRRSSQLYNLVPLRRPSLRYSLVPLHRPSPPYSLNLLNLHSLSSHHVRLRLLNQLQME